MLGFEAKQRGTVARLAFLWLLCVGSSAGAQSAAPGQPAQSEWERVLAAAKKEGKVAVSAQAGSNVRQAYVEGFQKAFPEIQVDYFGASGSKQAARMLSERRAGIYAVDVLSVGTTTMLEALLPEKVLDPILPALILPEVIDPGKWWQGRLDFSDKDGKYNLVFASFVKTPIAINPEFVKPGEIRSYWDLLNPKWAGKIAMKDPSNSGPGLATVTFWYAHRGLGKEFINQLFHKQPLAFSNNDRQLLEWLSHGKYSIVIAPSEFTATGLKAKGLSLDLVRAEQFKEGSYLTAGNGSVALINRAPHPNAAKVFLNWLLSREGQTLMSQSLGYVSRRLDVPRSHLEPWLLPKEGVEYQANYKEEYVRLKSEILPLLREVVQK